MEVIEKINQRREGSAAPLGAAAAGDFCRHNTDLYDTGQATGHEVFYRHDQCSDDDTVRPPCYASSQVRGPYARAAQDRTLVADGLTTLRPSLHSEGDHHTLTSDERVEGNG